MPTKNSARTQLECHLRDTPPRGAPRFAPPNRYVFGACGGEAQVGAQTPLAVHHAATYPKQLRARSYSSSAPGSWDPKLPGSSALT